MIGKSVPNTVKRNSTIMLVVKLKSSNAALAVARASCGFNIFAVAESDSCPGPKAVISDSVRMKFGFADDVVPEDLSYAILG